MAISYVASAVAESDTGVSSLSINKPSGTVDNDVLIMVASIGSAQTWTTPTGWTQIGSTAGTSLHTAAWYKVASSEGSSYNLSWSGGTSAVTAAVVSYRGCDTVTPLNVQNSSTSTTSQTVTGPSVTTTAACWLVYMRTTRDDTGTKSNVATSWTSATSRADEQFGVSTVVAHGVSIADNATTASAGPQSGAQSSSGTTTPTESVLRTIGLAAVTAVTPDAGSVSATATAEAPVAGIGVVDDNDQGFGVVGNAAAAYGATPGVGAVAEVATATGAVLDVGRRAAAQNATAAATAETTGHAAPAITATASAAVLAPSLTGTDVSATAGLADAAAVVHSPDRDADADAVTTTVDAWGPAVGVGMLPAALAPPVDVPQAYIAVGIDTGMATTAGQALDAAPVLTLKPSAGRFAAMVTVPQVSCVINGNPAQSVSASATAFDVTLRSEVVGGPSVTASAFAPRMFFGSSRTIRVKAES